MRSGPARPAVSIRVGARGREIPMGLGIGREIGLFRFSVDLASRTIGRSAGANATTGTRRGTSWRSRQRAGQLRESGADSPSPGAARRGDGAPQTTGNDLRRTGGP